MNASDEYSMFIIYNYFMLCTDMHIRLLRPLTLLGKSEISKHCSNLVRTTQCYKCLLIWIAQFIINSRCNYVFRPCTLKALRLAGFPTFLMQTQSYMLCPPLSVSKL